MAPLSALMFGMAATSTTFAQDQARSWIDRVSFSGEVEFEALLTKGGDNDESTADLPSFEFGLDASLSDSLEAYLLLVADAPDHDIELDEGGIIIKFGPGSLNLGKQYVPFGNYASQMISDPLTLELGEARESAATLGFEAGPVTTSVFLFDGGVDESGADDAVDNYGFGLGLATAIGAFSYDVGASYIDSLADSDGLEENFEEGIAKRVGGIGAYLITGAGPVSFIAEYVAATDSIDFEGSSAEPRAWNLELGYGFNVADNPVNFAVGFQHTEGAAELDLPENKALFTVSGKVLPALTLSFEYADEEDYGEAEGGDGGDTDVFTVQLALEF